MVPSPRWAAPFAGRDLATDDLAYGPLTTLVAGVYATTPREVRSIVVFEILGVVGVAISVLAYLPQVVHLARQHCSAGVSGRAWAMWLASSLLVGAVALHRHDPVFILLQLSTLISAAVIIVLVHRYRGLVCATHAAAYRRAAQQSDARRASRD